MNGGVAAAAATIAVAAVAAILMCADDLLANRRQHSVAPLTTIRHELFMGLSIQDRHCERVRGIFADTPMRLDGTAGRTNVAVPPPCPSREVNTAMFESFVEQEVVPRFPSGFTVLDANGYYGFGGTDGNGTVSIRERGKVMIVFEFRDGTIANCDNGECLTPTEQGLLDVAGLFGFCFQQESVLWAQSTASHVQFISPSST